MSLETLAISMFLICMASVKRSVTQLVCSTNLSVRWLSFDVSMVIKLGVTREDPRRDFNVTQARLCPPVSNGTGYIW